MIRLRPVSTRIWPKLQHRALRDEAVERVTLNPDSVWEHREAIALPNEFDRVKEVDEMSTLETQLERLNARRWHHPATIAYRLQQALIFEGCVYGRRSFESLRTVPRSPIVTGGIERRKDGQLCTNFLSENFFGHWLNDGLSLELLADENGWAPITLIRKAWAHESGYRDITRLHPQAVESTLFDSLWMVDDRHLNKNRINRLRRLHDAIRSSNREQGPRFVFIKRGEKAKGRRLVNEQSVVDELERKGFYILDPEKEVVPKIIGTLAHAQIVVGIEGSGLVHAFMAMPPNATVVTIQPPHRFSAFGKLLTDALDQRFAYVVADAHADGVTISIERLLKTIDLVDALTA